ncbi:response regulator [Rheinheimera baltica]|uniref:Response regulator n=2 Tax=Rheinheimera baltica TaxID=67576 RepID=A0ABT9HZF0_9GAMM|nr:response regulator [Rheinheimera baltica]MDP5136498.1 response regulator [Rheinheimera baltica]
MISQASFYKSKRLLLVEDCEPVRASIKGMLQQIGFEDITAVADATQAMPLVKKDSFDFILADFDLGSGKDASQFFAELSQQGLMHVNCCFLMFSAEPRRMPVLGVLHGSPDGFILKPFSYVELEKRLTKAWSSRAKLLKVYSALQRKDYEAAKLALDKIINAVNSSSLQALRLMAEVLLAEGNFSAAGKLYEQVTQQRDFSWARLGQAVTMLQLGEYQDAETLLITLSDLDDIRPEALEWLACLYLRQGQAEQTEKQLAELLRMQNSHISAHLATACSLQIHDKIDACSKYWQKLIQQYRFSAFDRPDYYFAFARLQLEQALLAKPADFSALLKKSADALAMLPQKLTTEHAEPVIAVLRARISLLQGNIADARQQFSLLESEAAATEPAAIHDRARLAFALGDIKAADNYMAQLKEFVPITANLTGECQRLTAQYLYRQEQQRRAQIRQWSQAGIDQTVDAEQSLSMLRQAFVFMPCNATLVLNLLQTLSQLPVSKPLLSLAKFAMTALEFSHKTASHQERLAQLLTQLPDAYLE